MSRKDLEAAEVPPFGKSRHTRVPKDRQSFEGMPGYIKTGQGTEGRESIRGHSSVGPKKVGPIGERGHGSTHHKVYGHEGGQITKNYKADSTGKAGHYKASAEGQPASEAHKGTAPIGGHPGRMERLIGRGVTHAEGRRKSKMY